MLSPVLRSELSALEPEYTDADVISTVEFSQSGEFLATGDKGGRVVIFQREPQGEYNVYSTFQSHEPEFDCLKSLEIEEKINKIRWLPQINSTHFLLTTNDKTIKLWKVSERDKRPEDIVDLKPENMEDLSEVITVAEFHPHHCHLLAFSSSAGATRLCDMRSRALCDRPAKLFEESVDPAHRSFFSEITSSVSDVKFSHSGRYLLTRDYLTAKVWDINMENKPVEIYQVQDYLRSKLCALYESDCIFDKFECAWNGTDSVIMTGAYNNFFRMFDRASRRDVTLEASREVCKRRAVLRPRRVCVGKKRRENDISVDSLDFRKKILHTAWHPTDNIIAIAASNNLYIFQDRHGPGHHGGHQLEQDKPLQLQDTTRQ
ncbi:hypothetical protein AMELA_G00010630 [Ameiurus melas]|uniref:Serine/threonine-protein phosphatase 2A 55 kDa regulatory subunit B n=1 Tax=Ameiurus melas TaxID=219545 RepID=A0A7J6BHA7_AMEME|nr:hypothetical protein AMELA_G00010630 [Ameiurus melas]